MMEGKLEKTVGRVEEPERMIGDKLNRRLERIVELEKQEADVKRRLDKLQGSVGSEITPVEWLIGMGLLGIASLCGTVLLWAFFRFSEALLSLAGAKPSLWNQANVTQAEGAASSFAWAAASGFMALAIAIAAVGLGASVALARIRRE